VYHNRRWDGDFLTIRRLLAEDALGTIDSLESRFERVAAVDGSWRESATEVGGPLRDLGPHLVDQSLALFGPARRVWAQLARRRPATEVDDSAFVAIDHVSGVQTRLWMSLIASRVGPGSVSAAWPAEYVKEDLDVQEAQLLAGMPE
jgi:predicted dehydrogenase